MKLAGAVTLYHPDDDVSENIKSYLDELDVLYVLDNTEDPNPKWADMFCTNKNVHYFPFHENKGISGAMNFALKEANRAGYRFLLTMDQDSHFDSGVVAKYKQLAESYEAENPGRTAMYTLVYEGDPRKEKVREVERGITSGSIVPVSVAEEIGGFDEALFIDEVDYEYCYRAGDLGYKVVEFPGIFMYHSVGERTYHSIFGFQYNTYNYPPIRWYYIGRNRVYVMRRYPRKIVPYCVNITKLIVKIILAEKNKGKKLRYMARGIWDGICGHMGKFKEK
jgi:rhamnosyltransferase